MLSLFVLICACGLTSAHIRFLMAKSDINGNSLIDDRIENFANDATRVIEFIQLHSHNQPIVFLLPGEAIVPDESGLSAWLLDAEFGTGVRLVVINFYNQSSLTTGHINIKRICKNIELSEVLVLYGLFMMFQRTDKEYVILTGNDMAIVGVESLYPIPGVFREFFDKRWTMSNLSYIVDFEKLWRFLYLNSMHIPMHLMNEMELD